MHFNNVWVEVNQENENLSLKQIAFIGDKNNGFFDWAKSPDEAYDVIQNIKEENPPYEECTEEELEEEKVFLFSRSLIEIIEEDYAKVNDSPYPLKEFVFIADNSNKIIEWAETKYGLESFIEEHEDEEFILYSFKEVIEMEMLDLKGLEEIFNKEPVCRECRELVAAE